MSDLELTDGTGSGNRAQVTSEHRLATESKQLLEVRVIAETTGRTYMLHKHGTLNSTNKHYVLYFKDNDAEYPMYLQRFITSWNGGTSSHNKTLKMGLEVGCGAPSANNYTYPALPSTNFSKQVPAIGEAQVWTGVGDGMTIASPGMNLFEFVYGQGLTDFWVNGALILPNGATLAVYVQGEEVGDFSACFSATFS